MHNEPMTAEHMEAYVRARCKTVQTFGTIPSVYLSIDENLSFVGWAAAYAFTKQREQEIAEIEADIKWATDARIVGSVDGYDMDSKRRTLARLNRELHALLSPPAPQQSTESEEIPCPDHSQYDPSCKRCGSINSLKERLESSERIDSESAAAKRIESIRIDKKWQSADAQGGK
jgi:hypothetical protein